MMPATIVARTAPTAPVATARIAIAPVAAASVTAAAPAIGLAERSAVIPVIVATGMIVVGRSHRSVVARRTALSIVVARARHVAGTRVTEVAFAARAPIAAGACVRVEIENPSFGRHPLDAVVRAAIVVGPGLGIGKPPGMGGADIGKYAVQRFAVRHALRRSRRDERERQGNQSQETAENHGVF